MTYEIVDGEMVEVTSVPIDWTAKRQQRAILVEAKATYSADMDAQIAIIDTLIADAEAGGIDTSGSTPTEG